MIRLDRLLSHACIPSDIVPAIPERKFACGEAVAVHTDGDGVYAFEKASKADLRALSAQAHTPHSHRRTAAASTKTK